MCKNWVEGPGSGHGNAKGICFCKLQTMLVSLQLIQILTYIHFYFYFKSLARMTDNGEEGLNYLMNLPRNNGSMWILLLCSNGFNNY